MTHHSLRIHQEANAGSLTGLALALDSEIEIESPDGLDRTALHLAVNRGHAECVAFLLSKGANPNARDYFGDSPLHFACRKNDIACLGLLLEAGADISSRNNAGSACADLPQAGSGVRAKVASWRDRANLLSVPAIQGILRGDDPGAGLVL